MKLHGFSLLFKPEISNGTGIREKTKQGKRPAPQKKMSVQKKAVFLCSLSALFYSGAFLLNKKALKPVEHPVYFAPPDLIRHFSFGFSEIYADLLWIRLIQNIDFCSAERGVPRYDGHTSHQCEKGWSYKITDTLTELAPRFQAPYMISGAIMSVIMRDKEGAKKIYDKGVQRFPDNWRLLFNAGYHYLMEIQDRQKGAELFLKAAESGGPPWLYDLSVHQYEEAGRLHTARKILLEMLQNSDIQLLRRHIKNRLMENNQKIRQMESMKKTSS